MKTTAAVILFILAALTPLSGQQVPAGPPAESTPPMPMQMVPRENPSLPAQAPPRARPPQGMQPEVPPLKNNVTLTIKGNILSDVPVNLVFTGAGPRFTIATVLATVAVADAKQPIVGQFTATVVQTDDGYRVEYGLNCQYPYVASTTSSADAKEAPRSSINNTNIGLAGSVILQPDKPVTVINNNGSELTLAISNAETK